MRNLYTSCNKDRLNIDQTEYINERIKTFEYVTIKSATYKDRIKLPSETNKSIELIEYIKIKLI